MPLNLSKELPVDDLASYEWGKVINFGLRGNAGAYCKAGWSEPESGMVWTDSKNSRLSLAVAVPTADVTLVLNCNPFISKGVIDRQELHLYINFLRVEYLEFTEERSVEIIIPKHVFVQSECHIDFYIPTARSPADLGLNPDIRRLGFALSRLMLVHG